VDDCTPEALAVVMHANKECIGLFSAEGGPFEIMGGRYSERGSNFEIYLKAHPGDPHVVDRIRRPPIHLSHPLLTMVLTVQPEVISGLAAKDGFRGKGLLARILYAIPATSLGSRKVDTAPVNEKTTATYVEALRSLLTADAGRTLRMSERADQLRAEIATYLEPRLGPDGDLHPCRDWAGKLVGAICRIAGVLHVADHAQAVLPMPEEIPLLTFERAYRIGLYFLEHAIAALGSMGADEATTLSKRVWGWIQRKEILEFTEREARRAVHATAEDIKPALAKLVERNLVRERASAPTGGRPTVMFDVNPRTCT
jgi:hypothetical protein